MPNARDTVLRAFADLERSSGSTEFRADEIWHHIATATTQFRQSTIRTYVTSVMCANAPIHHANHTDDLVRVKRAFYRRVLPSDDLAALRAQGDSHYMTSKRYLDAASKPSHERGNAQAEWHWEGNIQAAMVAYLAGDGWSIRSVADTGTREHGVDIIAAKEGVTYLVEVKGYPSEYYVRGERMGQKKPTAPSIQARVWFADLLMSSMINSSDDHEARIVLCLPDVPTYLNLAARVATSLDLLEFTVAFVSANGDVTWRSTEGHR